MKNFLKAIFVFMIIQGSYAGPTNKRLVIGMSQEFDSLNPMIMSMSASTYISYTVSRTINILDKDWNWVCALCVNIPDFKNKLAYIKKIKGKEKLFAKWEIKKDAKWGDGTPILARDFKLSWEIGNASTVSIPGRDIYQRIEQVIIDKKNPKKFTLVYKEPRFNYRELPITPLPSHLEGVVWNKAKNKTGAYEKQTLYNQNPTNPGLYSGPYVIKEIKVGSHVIIKKNPHWTGQEANIEKIIFKLIPNTQTLEANLISGTIDMISTLGMSFDQAVAFEKRLKRNSQLKKKFSIRFREGLVYEHIDLNLDNEHLKDIRVRKALVYSIDRDKLTMALFGGRQKKAISSVHPIDPTYNKDKLVEYAYDPKKAKGLLDAAGYKVSSDGYRYKNGKKLTLRLMTTAQNKTRELVESWLQDEWKKIGIHITIKNEPARVYFGETVRKRKFPALAMFAWTSAPESDHQETLHSKEIPTKKNGWSGSNYTGYVNFKVDKLIKEFQREFKLQVRKELMGKIQFHYTNDVPVIPLYMRSDNSVVPATLKNYAMTGHQYANTNFIETWNIETK